MIIFDQTQTAPEELFEMANLSPKRTGLPFVVWISQAGNARDDARVRVSIAPIDRALNGRDLALLARWVELNRDVIIDFWNGEIEYTEDAIASLKSV